MTKKPRKGYKFIYKRSDTGRICSKAYAEANPDTTFATEVEAKGGRPKS